MPDKTTMLRAKRDARQGKAPTTQAGEFVREEIHHIREGKHGARSAKQAVAIGLSKARKAGVALPPKPGTEATGGDGIKRVRISSESAAKRSRATLSALKKEPKASASHAGLATQARRSAARRGPSSLHSAAMKAVATKGPAGLHRAAQKAAATRQRGH